MVRKTTGRKFLVLLTHIARVGDSEETDKQSDSYHFELHFLKESIKNSENSKMRCKSELAIYD